MRTLEVLLIDDPLSALPHIEEALEGRRSFLPVPAHDPNRAGLLRTTQRAGEPIEEDVALVMCTSGSTGTPKGALLSAQNLRASVQATAEIIGQGSWVLAMPAHYIAGMQVLVRSVLAGTTPQVLDVRGGFSIPDFARLRGDYVSLTPMQLLKAMDYLDGIEALREYKAVLVGGAGIPDDALRAAKELGITVVTTYGASETAGGCVYNGYPIPGAHVALDGQRVVLSGPMVARGYRTPDPALQDGTFYTSDAGQLIDGRLEILGRMDTIIDSGGVKVHPEVVEKHLLNVDGVSAAAVVGIPDPRLGTAVACGYEGTASPLEVIAALNDAELPAWEIPREIRQMELPKLSSGKVDRLKLQQVLAG
ncbi:o-succinylbenzoate--CoA ligase [Corynebacterium renale]|uniref:O-succinylbenzoic acid--CoA ligase n=1 Tax=Corynebacterium renale TaxID=1724 RepID=A0A2A9DMV5_9CORY|nr:o-succinylbenzoate--CoA ligase [Corynebacterium renale]PFG27292.1 O-succinylbenzoic acid--CoA ligase [Corynebacterium renale]SQI23622.1 O-succinylbenzoic acid--CoA ligase [Corynebacterium renale]